LVCRRALGSTILVAALGGGRVGAGNGGLRHGSDQFAGAVEVGAAAAEANRMTIEVRNVGAGESTVTVADRASALTAGTGCSSDPSGEVECSVEGP
jgi:hypothetical protein